LENRIRYTANVAQRKTNLHWKGKVNWSITS